MKTLELKDICGYLPYGLKFLSDYFSAPHEIVSIDLTDNTADFSNNCGYTNKSLGEVKPILRPMSDLTNEITYKGEKFVPIVEIGRLIEPDGTWVPYREGAADLGEGEECMAYLTHEGDGFVLRVDDEIETFDMVEIFDQLAEWKFDYRGLIPAGLAIDVNTLPENPYER